MFPILDTNLCLFPKVTWWRDHALLDSTDSNQASFKTENELSLKDLKRSDLHSILTCQASNNNISVPVSTSVKLDMNCKYIFRAFSQGHLLSFCRSFVRSYDSTISRWPCPPQSSWSWSVSKNLSFFPDLYFICKGLAENIYFLSVAPSYDCTTKNPIFCFSFHQSEDSFEVKNSELFFDWLK